jgi:Sulfatase
MTSANARRGATVAVGPLTVRTTSVWARLPFHPIAIALAPVLSMFASYPGSLERADAGSAMGAAVTVAIALVCVAAAAYRDVTKAALFVCVLLAVFVTVGALYESIEDWQLAGYRVARRRYFVPLVYLGLAAFGLTLFRSRRRLTAITALANIVTLGALLPPAIRLANVELTGRGAGNARVFVPALAADVPPTAKPDIYYVVFDRYGDERTLREHGVDNTPQFEYLANKGFFVARDSRSNYINTFLSLASSLNFTYLDEVPARVGGAAEDWRPIHELILSHRAGAFLRGQGYEYFHLGTWHPSTRWNPQATRNINYYTAVPRAAVQLLDNPLFEPVQRAFDSPLIDHRRQHWERIVWQVDDAVRLAAAAGPKFVFLHLLVPHQPYVFDRDGRFVPRDEENRRTRRENYANQVRAANALMRRLIDGVLERSPSPPVIVVQGDEGPYPDGTEGRNYEWSRATPDILRTRSGILNAYYLPGEHSTSLYASISPVNSFRVVFNAYLGTRLPLLPDRTIRHGSHRRPFTFTDITHIVNARPPGAVTTTGSRREPDGRHYRRRGRGV